MERYEYKNKLGYKISFYFDKDIINLSISDINKKEGEINLFEKLQLYYENNYNKYITDFIELIKKIKTEQFIINLEEKTKYDCYGMAKEKQLKKDDNKKEIKYLILTINEKKDNKHQTFIKKNIYVLNLEFYLTTGPYNKRINSKPFYSCFKKDKFNLDDVIEFLEKENILSIYDIDYFRYYNYEKGVFQIISKDLIPITKKLILEFHYTKVKDPYLINFKWAEEHIKDEIINVKNQIKKYSEYTKNYDLIFLYASPIIDEKKNESDESLDYIKEIRIIIELMKRKKKQFNCLFECIGLDVLSDVLIRKKTKILHISSHGMLDDDCNYSIGLENLHDFGQMQKIELSKLKSYLEVNKDKIQKFDLVIVSTCFSEDFGKLFLEYGAKNVIYIYKKTPIYDYTSIKFSEYFYQNLIEGCSIKESFDKAINILRCDKNIEIPCCCEHFHKKDCKLKQYKKINNTNHHINCKKSCKCTFFQKNIHDINKCNYYSQYKSELKKEDIELQENFMENNNNIIKICCCDNNIIHDEIMKIKYEYNEQEEYKNICPFKYNVDGDVFIDSKICFHYEVDKNYTIIGRKPLMGQIFNNIKANDDIMYYSILYGEKGLLIQNFVESLCVYLKERKTINNYRIFRIKSNFDFFYFKGKIVENIENNCKNNKMIKIINLDYDDMEESIKVIKKVQDLYYQNKFFLKYNLYFIFILNTIESKDEEKEKLIYNYIQKYDIKINSKNEYKNCFYAGLGLYGPRKLLEHLTKNSIVLNNDNTNNLLIKANNLPQKIKKIAELLLEKISPEEILNFKELQFPNIKLNELNETSLLTLYYILLNMPSGLPDCFLQLIFKDYIFITDEKRLISRYPESNWNYIEKDERFKEYLNEIKDRAFLCECLFKLLKIYISLLSYFIENKKEKTNYYGGNIHYIYNSFNINDTWKIKEQKNIEEIFGKKISNKDLSIQRHKNNILHLIFLIVDNIDLFRELSNISIQLDIYLEKILLLFPSYFFLTIDCVSILKTCIKYCDKLLNNTKNEIKKKRYIYLKHKLLLFLYSINENENEILKIKDIEQDLEIEKKILKAIRLKKGKRKMLKELIKDERINGKLKSYLYYEISTTYFHEKKYEECLKNMQLALDLNNINDIYKYRIIIDSCSVFKKQFIKKIRDSYDSKKENKIVLGVEYILNEEKNNYDIIMEKIKSLNDVSKKTLIKELYYEAYYLKNELYEFIIPDITILNSNPLKNSSGFITVQHNNHYYILNQLKKNINSFIKIKSEILNNENLNKALNRKGEILIIQSDDFTDDGDILSENEKGKSEIIQINQLFNNTPSKKINYKVIILCFPKSSKLIDYFNKEIDFQFLITFEDLDYSGLKHYIMKKYNKLSIQFIIDFIKYTIENQDKNDDIEKNIFKQAKNDFVENIKHDINCQNYIILSKKDITNQKIVYSKSIKEKEIFLYEPLIKIEDYEINNFYDYSENIYELIKEINFTGYHILYSDKYNKKNNIEISFEVMKYYYRHKTYLEFFYFDINKHGKEKIKSIIRRLNKMWNEKIDDIDETEENEEIIYTKMCFILIYNCKWNDLLDVNIFSLLKCNSSFIIIYNEDIKHSKKLDLIKTSKVLINKMPLLIEFVDKDAIFIDDYSIYVFFGSQGESNKKKEDIKCSLLNYKLDMAKNGNLFQYVLYGGPFDEENAKFLFYKILKCVELLHNNNFCHLDLELGNIMLDQDNNPTILNIGPGLGVKENENLTKFNGIINEYTPPELEGKEYDYDGYKVDIYNLGVMLFKLVIGDKPTNPPIYKNITPSDEFKNLFDGMTNNDPYNRYSFDDIYESDWLRKTKNLFGKGESELEDMKQKFEKELEQKKEELIKGTKMNIIKNMVIKAEDRTFNKGMSMNVIPKSDIYSYNIIIIPVELNPIHLINIFYMEIEKDKVHYTNLNKGNQYNFIVEIIKEENNNNSTGKRIKIEIELYKIENENTHFFRINYIGNNVVDLDEFFSCIDKIKEKLDSIIEKETRTIFGE